LVRIDGLPCHPLERVQRLGVLLSEDGADRLAACALGAGVRDGGRLEGGEERELASAAGTEFDRITVERERFRVYGARI
jgi:hypothetical protein